MCPYFISILRRNMRHNLKKSQEITKTEETGIYCYFFTIYLIKLFKFFSLFTSNHFKLIFTILTVYQLWLCFSDFCWPSIHGSNTFITKDGSPSNRCKLSLVDKFFDRDHSPRHKDRNSKYYQEKHKHSEGHKSRHSSHEYKHHSSHRY